MNEAGAGARLARNTGVLIGAELVIKLFNLGFYAVLSRELLSRGFGAWTYGLGVVTVYATVFNWGLSTLFTREVARDPHAAGDLLGRLLPLRFALVGIALLGLAPLAWAQRTMGAPLFVCVLGVAPLASMVGESFRAVFRARQQLHLDAALTLAERALSSGLALIALLATHSLVWVAAGWTAGALLAAVAAGVWVLGTHVTERVRWRFERVGELARAATPLFLLGVLGQLYFRQDVVILQALTQTEAVGYYGAAYRLFEMFVFLPGSLTQAYLPAAAALRETAPEAFHRLVRRTLSACLAVSVPLSLFLSVRTDEVIRLLFGSGFEPAVPAARVVVWTLTLYCWSAVLGHTLIAGGRQRVPAIAVACAVPTNLLLNLWWIPQWGIVGAAWATFASEALILLVEAWIVWREIGLQHLGAVVLRPAAAAGILAGALWMSSAWPLPAAAACAAVSYGVAAWGMGLLPRRAAA